MAQAQCQRAGVSSAVENVDMGELLTGIVEDAHFEGAAQQIDIVYTPGEMSEMVVIRANPELLHRAIENVVRNALRFSSTGGAIQIAAGRVDSGHLKISIGDDGPGVPESQLENIFKPFFRGDAQNTAGGYGLGLAIAQRVIAAVNGKIQAKNKFGGGLVVEMDLPV